MDSNPTQEAQKKSELFSSQAFPTKTKTTFSNMTFSRTYIAQGTDRTHFNELRNKYLKALSNGSEAVVILVTGASASGKSYVVNLLKETGIIQAERMLTRPYRNDDPESDTKWNNSKPLLFTYGKYVHYYGFPDNSLGKNLIPQGTEDPEHQAFIVGDVGKIASAFDAVQHAVPGAPVVTLRIDVPPEIAEERLTKVRVEAYDGEGKARIAANNIIRSWEDRQIPLLKSAYGIHKLLNISSEEHARHGYVESQLKPLSPELLFELMEGFIAEAYERSAAQATHLLEPQHLGYHQPGIPNSLVEVLEKQLIPGALERKIVPVIKGGLAAAIYLQNSWKHQDAQSQNLNKILFKKDETLKSYAAPLAQPFRQVSPDIDWTMLNDPSILEAHQELISEVSGIEDSFHDAFEKPVFHSRKINSATLSKDGEEVELDAISVSRVQPGNKGFCYEFTYDEYLDFFHREVTLPDGGTAQLVPPELLLVEKLAAGRGAEQGKLDLPDAAGILATQPVDLILIKHILEEQIFDPEVDSIPEALIEAPDMMNTAERIRALGIESPELVTALTRRILSRYKLDRTPAEKQSAEAKLSVPMNWTPDTLKKAGLIDVLLKSLNKLEKEIEDQDTIAGNEYDTELLTEKISSFKSYLRYYSEYQLGRSDVYVNRDNLFISKQIAEEMFDA